MKSAARLNGVLKVGELLWINPKRDAYACEG